MQTFVSVIFNYDCIQVAHEASLETNANKVVVHSVKSQWNAIK